jgi:hypothetical protein
MIRILNFTMIVITGLISLGVYRIAEQARMTTIELRETKAGITRENQSLTVLGAEWARLTQPARIQALAQRYLSLDDRPAAQRASITQLPSKFATPPESAFRNANAVMSQRARAVQNVHAGT